MSSPRKLLVIQCAALGWNQIDDAHPELAGLRFSPLQPPSPAVTCTAQATFRTAAPPASHGMVANGLFHRNLRKSMFWEQAADQVQGPRIWENFRDQGGSVGITFWQQSLGEDVDLVLSPRPIHKHSGGMIQDCYSLPDPLYHTLRQHVGRDFNLMHYWGPLASRKSSEWITDAICALLDLPDQRPDLLLTYLPHLDYNLQRHGPQNPRAPAARKVLDTCLRRLIHTAQRHDYPVLVWGDYPMHQVTGPAIFPNRILRDDGLLPVRLLKGMAYPDLFSARAFAMVDHEIAHIYLRDPKDLPHVQSRIAQLDGVHSVLPRQDLPHLDHPNSGELIAFAHPGRWFSYPWWSTPRQAPDFATHVDIHNKPGFDACELFFGRLPWHVSQNTAKVRGSHGALGPNSQTAWACTAEDFPLPHGHTDLISLANATKSFLDS